MAKTGIQPPAAQYSYESVSPQDILAEASYQAMDFTLDNLTETGAEAYIQRAFQDENQTEGSYSRTHLHETQVGGILLAVTQDPEIALTGCLHDTGKGREIVRSTIILPRFLTDEEREIVSAHAQFGAEDLKGAVTDTELNDTAQFVARHHHAQRPDSFDDTEHKRLWDITSLVQVTDRAQAVLLDWEGRPYKADRMTREGLLNDAGRLVMNKAMEAVLKGDAGQSYLGISAEDIVYFAAQCMPCPEWIKDNVEGNRQAMVTA